MKRLSIFLVIFITFGTLASGQSPIFNPMRDAIKAGDATTLVKYFAESADINIEGTINKYSRAQSEFILKDFFKKYPADSFVQQHSGNSPGGLQFVIYDYNSTDQKFTVMMRAREIDGKYRVHEISFIREVKR